MEVEIERVSADSPNTEFDNLAIEEPLEIQLVYGPSDARTSRPITVTMRTPGCDRELAAGFLLSEGIVRDVEDIARISSEQEPERSPSDEESILPADAGRNSVRVELAPEVQVRMSTLERNFYTTSSCGICGKASLLAIRSVCPPRRKNEFTVEASTLHQLPGRLREAQELFASTGGLHGAALFDAQGKLELLREDVGRHNAVDKLLGAQLLNDRIPLRNRILLLSGRASFELLQKAVMAGIPMVAAVGAPSSLAVRVAEEFDVTLVGFLRDNRFNIYHGAQRILF